MADSEENQERGLAEQVKGAVMWRSGSQIVGQLIAWGSTFLVIRMLNPADLTLTGLTRDGTFWIEGGRISHAVNNFRWNESPVRCFDRAEAMSRPERVADADWAVTPSYVPAVRSSTFKFASISQADHRVPPDGPLPLPRTTPVPKHP